MDETDDKGSEIAAQTEAINRLAREVERLNGHRFMKLHGSRWRMMMFSLSRGLAFGLGSVLGGGILVSLLGWWLSQFEFLPYIGEWAAQLVKEIQGAE